MSTQGFDPNKFRACDGGRSAMPGVPDGKAGLQFMMDFSLKQIQMAQKEKDQDMANHWIDAYVKYRTKLQNWKY